MRQITAEDALVIVQQDVELVATEVVHLIVLLNVKVLPFILTTVATIVKISA